MLEVELQVELRPKFNYYHVFERARFMPPMHLYIKDDALLRLIK